MAVGKQKLTLERKSEMWGYMCHLKSSAFLSMSENKWRSSVFQVYHYNSTDSPGLSQCNQEPPSNYTC